MGRRRRFRLGSPSQVLVDRLKRKDVSDVTFDGRVLSLQYDGQHLSRQVHVGESVLWVGEHSGNVVRVDDDLHLVEALSLAVHETVEDYLEKRYGLSSLAEAHEIADDVETRWLRRHTRLKPKAYSQKVERVFRKEMAHRGLA